MDSLHTHTPSHCYGVLLKNVFDFLAGNNSFLHHPKSNTCTVLSSYLETEKCVLVAQTARTE